jgi:hypothetical protein
MELNELEIAQDSASTSRQRQSTTCHTQGIGGVGVEPSDPACQSKALLISV